MSHSITAIVIAGSTWNDQAASDFDLVAVPLAGVTMFHIDHYYSAYWQAKLGWTGLLERPPGASLFPDEAVLAHIAAALVGSQTPTFAIIETDYFGGAGGQAAGLYIRTHRANGDAASIDDVLRMLGVVAAPGLDEFDTVGLGAHRSAPEYLERYIALCEQLGV